MFWTCLNFTFLSKAFNSSFDSWTNIRHATSEWNLIERRWRSQFQIKFLQSGLHDFTPVGLHLWVTRGHNRFILDELEFRLLCNIFKLRSWDCHHALHVATSFKVERNDEILVEEWGNFSRPSILCASNSFEFFMESEADWVLVHRIHNKSLRIVLLS